mgnify:CR=1 FL=1
MKKLAFLLLIGVLVSCGSTKMRQAYRLEPGMTKSQVIEIMGEPMRSDFDRNVEEWHYCRTQIDSETFLALYFVDGKLLTKTNYTVIEENKGSLGSCAQFIKMGNYRVPDTVVEIRER